MKTLISQIRQWRWDWQHLGPRKLASGMEVAVKSAADLIIYKEIFENGSYDVPIRAALLDASPGRPLRVLDLGANVGYFIFRLADLAGSMNHGKIEWEAIAVEGCPDTYGELWRRISKEVWVRDRVKTCLGLVGERNGWGAITLDPYHFAASVSASTSSGNEIDVPYVNLDGLVEAEAAIDLLKCDIEGAECDFIENYGALLKRVRRLCIEFHGHSRKEHCLKLLGESGFSVQQELSDEGEGDSRRWVYSMTKQA